MTYTSAFRSTGIGTTYAGAFKSAGTGSKNAGIGYIHILIKAVPTQVKMPEQGLKALGPIPALLKSAGTGPRDPIPTFKSQRFEAPGKKCRDRNFDPIPALFRAIPALFKTLG